MISEKITGNFIMDYPITGLKNIYGPEQPFRINCRVKNHTDSTHTYQIKFKAYDGNGNNFSFVSDNITLLPGQYIVWTGTDCPPLDGYKYNYACIVNIKFAQVFWTQSNFFKDAQHLVGPCTCPHWNWVVPKWKKDYNANYVDLTLELYRDGIKIDNRHKRVYCYVKPFRTISPIVGPISKIPSPTVGPITSEPTNPPHTLDPNIDTDKDGIPDSEDACPYTKGSINYNGCPPNDRDGDGVLDSLDKCPDIYGLGEDGCPVESSDKYTQKTNPLLYAFVAILLCIIVVTGYWRLKK